MAAAVNGLVTQGMSWQQATGHGDLLAELIKGQRMAPEDAAKLIYSFGQNGVSPQEMRKTMGELAVAGDLGAFEANAMAKFMPEMLATTGALGFQGPEAVRYLAASLQAQVKLTGDPDSAANNLKNLLAKITAPDIAKKFDDKGFDLQASMRAQMRQGKNPIEAFIALTESLAAGGDKGKQQQLQAMKEKVGPVVTKGDEAAALDAYMKMAGLGDIITDMQARAAALAQIKYGKQISAGSEGLSRKPMAVRSCRLTRQSRDATSNAKWDAAKNSFNAAMVDIGDAIRPVTDGAAELSASMLASASDMAKAHPGVALGAVAAGVLTVGAAAAKVSGGMLQWGLGKVLAGAGGKLPGVSSGVPGAGWQGARCAGWCGRCAESVCRQHAGRWFAGAGWQAWCGQARYGRPCRGGGVQRGGYGPCRAGGAHAGGYRTRRRCHGGHLCRDGRGCRGGWLRCRHCAECRHYRCAIG